MNIDENTKVIGRFHREVSPRGLNIYNPFFEEAKINALYLLFYDPDPKVLMNGYRSLKLTGAVCAGFESNEVLPTLLDEVDDVSKFVGKVGYISNENGKVVGHAQAGQGMLRTIKHIMNPTDKKIVIVGAGNVTKGLLFEIEKEKINCSISLYNRTREKADTLRKRFSFVTDVGELSDIEKASGDIFVNLTNFGGKVKETPFNSQVIEKFQGVVDVTFEKENTDLIELAKKLQKKVATGWDMFTYQGQVCLEGILHQKVEYDLLKKYVRIGLSSVVK